MKNKLLYRVCAGLIGLALGVILGDELNQRLDRARLRSSCYEFNLAQAGGVLSPGDELRVEVSCRQAVP